MHAVRLDLVTRRELIAQGESRSSIAHALKSGRLHRRHAGVYSRGRADLPEPGRFIAAVLACGDGALLSHKAAAHLWSIAALPLADAVDVTVTTGGSRSRQRLRVHRLRLDPRERRTREGIPLTSPPRTLLDLAATVDAGELEQAVVEADIRRLANATELRAQIARVPSHPGAAALAAIVARGAWQGLTRSQAERLFLSLVGRARLPAPAVNPVRTAHRIDFLWPSNGLVVEINGFATHGRRAAFDTDHDRDLDLELGGSHVLRFTANQLRDAHEAVIATVASELARRAAA